MFIVNLAIADLCVTGFTDPMSITGVVLGPQFFNKRMVLCHVIGTICLSSCACSLWTISTISINRFILICHNQYYARVFTWRRTILYCLLLWLSAYALDVPNYLNWGDHNFDEKIMACSYDRTAAYSYTAFFILSFVAFPLVIVSYCNVQIYLTVKRSKMKVAAGKQFFVSTTGKAPVAQLSTVSHTMDIATSHVPSVDKASVFKPEEGGTTSINANFNSAEPGQAMRCKVNTGDLKLAKTLFVVFLVFCVCWAPYGSLLLLDMKDVVSKEYYVVAIKLAHTSSSVNPLVYAALNKNFMDGYKLFLRKITGTLPRK